MREKGGRKKKGKKKREGDGFTGVEERGLLRSTGPHTNNARST